VIRAVADLPEPDRSVVQLRYGLMAPPLSEEDAAAQLGLTIRELWRAESEALEALGFLLLTEVSVLELLESLR
jgi:DNA-directed RNA polymerase specialized sigma24 family protein